LDIQGDLPDYKFFCFNGKVEFCHIVEDRSTHLKDYIMSKDWNNMNFNFSDRSFIPDAIPNKPTRYEDMIKYAEILSEGEKFVRIDFYEYNGDVYFGEYTYYPWGGFYKIQSKPEDYKRVNEYLDSLIRIS